MFTKCAGNKQAKNLPQHMCESGRDQIDVFVIIVKYILHMCMKALWVDVNN